MQLSGAPKTKVWLALGVAPHRKALPRSASALIGTDGAAVSCSLPSSYVPLSLTDISAVGTPLDWPDAKKAASHVRSWGIEVDSLTGVTETAPNFQCSNCLRYGAKRRAKNEMPYCGVMRYGKAMFSLSVCFSDHFQIEYLVVSFDDSDRQVKLSLHQADILEALANDEELIKQGGGVPDLNEGQPK